MFDVLKFFVVLDLAMLVDLGKSTLFAKCS